MTDIPRLLSSLKRRSAHAKEFGDDVTFVKLEDIDALIETLETAQQQIDEVENDEVHQRLANAEHQLRMAELAKHNLKVSRKAQFRKRKAAEKRVAELESRTVTVKLPKRSVGEVMHMSGFSRDYAEGWCAGNVNAIHEIQQVGIAVENNRYWHTTSAEE
ncbi:ead/Ea22-like family protein [Klebsiella aerogenes]|uniref:ead/Ea22-like family protein n=1 Tax=Klebsiella aerogenes TaxID=548 RepID=UPI001CFC4337|nr:ead/Ea22-like family protein [Klebsiella aerogenes]